MRRHLLLAALGLSLLFGTPGTVHSEDAGNPHVLMKTSLGDIEIEMFKDQAPLTVANFLGLANGTKQWKNQEGKSVRKPFFDGLTFHRVIDGFMIQGGCPKGDGTGDPGYMFQDEMNAKSLGLDKKMVFTNGRPHPWVGGTISKLVGPMLAEFGHSSATVRQLSPEQQKELEAKLIKKLSKMSLEQAYVKIGYRYDPQLKSTAPLKGTIAMANSGPNTNGSQFFITLEDTERLSGKHTVFGKVVKGFEIVQKIGKVKVAGTSPVTPVKILSVRSVAASAAATPK